MSAVITGNNLFNTHTLPQEVIDISHICFCPNLSLNIYLQISNNLVTLSFRTGLALPCVSCTETKLLIYTLSIATKEKNLLPGHEVFHSGNLIFLPIYPAGPKFLLNCLLSCLDCHLTGKIHAMLSSVPFFWELAEKQVYVGRDGHRLGRLNLWNSQKPLSKLLSSHAWLAPCCWKWSTVCTLLLLWSAQKQ